MIINILDNITQAMASNILRQLEDTKDSEILVNIMSPGGSVYAGAAIMDGLRIHPATVTTKVYGVAASMASAISQVGDTRLIAEDAIFQPHNAAGLPNKRPTKEALQEAADELELMDEILVKSYNKSNLSEDGLRALLQQDKPMNAQRALDLGFFDGKIEAIKAAAELNNLIMENKKPFMERLQALASDLGINWTPKDPEAQDPALVEELMGMVEQMGALIAKLQAAPPPTEEQMTETVQTQVEASLKEALSTHFDEFIKTLQSDGVVPPPSATGTPPKKEDPKADESQAISVRQAEIQEKFNSKFKIQ